MDINLYVDENNPENNIITNPLHLFLQEIELAVKIGPFELWGFKHNIDLQSYMFNQYITFEQVEQEIASFITRYCEHAVYFQFEILAELIEIESKTLLYIKATIEDTSNIESQKITQKFILGEL